MSVRIQRTIARQNRFSSLGEHFSEPKKRFNFIYIVDIYNLSTIYIKASLERMFSETTKPIQTMDGFMDSPTNVLPTETIKT